MKEVRHPLVGAGVWTAVFFLVTALSCGDDTNGDGSGNGNDGNGSDDGDTMKACMAVCKDKTECPTGMAACRDGMCVGCEQNSDCDADKYKGGCNTSLGMCKMCGTDADCEVMGKPVATGKCDSTFGLCMKCNSELDCDFSGSLYKKCADNICVECVTDDDCTTGARCVKTNGMPFCGCTKDTDCPTYTKCNTSSQLCECADTQTCEEKFGKAEGTWECKEVSF